MRSTSRLLHLLVLLALLFSAGAPSGRARAVPVDQPAPAPLVSPNIVISQVYGGGGNSSSLYKYDFIELFNRGTEAVDITGWSVQYASSTGTNWGVTPLSGTIAPGQYYLVQEAKGNGGTEDLPTPDAIGSIAMSATAGKVALVNHATALTGSCPSNRVDFFGFGAANCHETQAFQALNNTTAALRIDRGDKDTDNNYLDFTPVDPPEPKNSSYVDPTVDYPPYVSYVFPPHNSTHYAGDFDVLVTFSEAVNLPGEWVTISCSLSGVHTAAISGGPSAYTLNPNVDFSSGEICTVTLSDGITDIDRTPDPLTGLQTWSFRIAAPFACGQPADPLHIIQGNGTANMGVGQMRTIEGLVTAAYQSGGINGFFVQDAANLPDSDPLTSEGLFVAATTPVVQPGDIVRLTGEVAETHNVTTLTNLTASEVCSSGNPLPAPEVLSPPFPAAVDSVSYLERFEGMRVSLPAGLYVTELYTLGQYGEFWLSSGDRLWNPTNVVEPGPDAAALQAANDLNRILVDDRRDGSNPVDPFHPAGGLSPTNRVRVGDTTAAEITGVLTYGYNYYRIQPDAAATFNPTNPRPAATLDNGDALTVASFNVLNYFNGNGQGGGFPTSRGAGTYDEFLDQRAKIIQAIHSLDADVIGLMEVENDGYGALSATQDLVTGLNELAGSGTYAFVNPGVTRLGNDVIAVGLLYKPAVVSPVGTPAFLTTGVFDPVAVAKHRVPLARTFKELRSDEEFTVVVNHFKSKGSCPSSGINTDQRDGQGCWNPSRAQAATELAAWLAGNPTGIADPDVLIIGDINAYALEDPIDNFKTAGYTDLDSDPHAYSYIFEGQTGRLDHALASATLTPRVLSAFAHHINVDEPPAFDYNDWNAPQLYVADVYRSADHDPTLVLLNLTDDAVYADPAGQCGGNAPCFTTIQAAVQAVSVMGTVNVYPGGYPEWVNVNRNVNLTLLGDVTVIGLTLADGSLAANAANLTVMGDWTLSGGAFDPGAGTVIFTSQMPQTLTGATTFTGLTIQNLAEVQLASDVTVNGALTLTAGWLDLQDSHLTLAADAAIAGTPTAANMVVATGLGELRRTVVVADPEPFTFPVGDADGDPEYTPVTLDLQDVVGEGYVAVRLTDAPHPGLAQPPRLTRYWTLAQSGLTSYRYTGEFQYTDADLELNGAQEYDITPAFRHPDGYWYAGGESNAAENILTFRGNLLAVHSGMPVSPAGVESLAIRLEPLRLPGVMWFTWTTADETNLLGFDVYRAAQPNGPLLKLNSARIDAVYPGEPESWIYNNLDPYAVPGLTYDYFLAIYLATGEPVLTHPFTATMPFVFHMPIILHPDA